MIENYSASSLKLLLKDKEEYEKRYKLSLFFRHTNEYEKTGNMFHKLIYYYLNGFDIEKIINNLNGKDKEIWQKFIESGILKENYIAVEQSFSIKEKEVNEFFLNGRFDAILKEGDTYIIYDWKSENIPKDPENDIQTIVYMYSASKLFNTENIKIRYVSIKKLETCEVSYDNGMNYKKMISDIVAQDN